MTIGQTLKQRREDLGYSLEDIQEKTKISIVKLRAIENDDLDFFKHELSYLRFFIEYYARAVHVPFEELQPELDAKINEYSETLVLKRLEQRDAQNANIRKRMKTNIDNYQPSQVNKKGFGVKRDVSSILMVILSLIIIGVLIYGTATVVWPLLTGPKEVINVPDVPNVPEAPDESESPDETPTPDDSEDPVEEPAEVVVTQVDAVTYNVDLNGIETAYLKINFGTDTWTRLYVNEVAINNPAEGIYGPGASIELLLDPTKQTQVTVHVGTMVNNEFFINNQKVVLDPATASTNSGIKITFNLVSEQL